MQEKRLELSWYYYHTDLNRTRLPIPPFLRDKLYYIGNWKKCQSFLAGFFGKFVLLKMRFIHLVKRMGELKGSLQCNRHAVWGIFCMLPPLRWLKR